MSDPRLLASNGRVASRGLQGVVEAAHFTDGVLLGVAVPVVDLCREPAGIRDRQLVFGEVFCQLEQADGWAFGYRKSDGYVGYVAATALRQGVDSTHIVTASMTHIYPEPDLKSRERMGLPFGARLCAKVSASGWLECEDGFVPVQHVAPEPWRARDPVEIAERFIGVPYLWGGNSIFGIDCSGLVQTALQAVGKSCPGDSDLQEKAFTPVQGAPERGDLVFWPGHVGILLDGGKTILHANSHHMAVTVEPLDDVRRRIMDAALTDRAIICRP